ncbi:MAG: AMP-binding protein [Gammaproteobacteria bacterium]|nr:MAG: AMP-binding protein [Gammaproteobacteria bacterium]
MEMRWLQSYPPGVPHRLEIDPADSIVRMLEEACRRFAAQPAFASFGRSISYSELDRLTQRFAAYLQRLGLRRGDRVALMMPNLLQYPVALYGVMRAGMVVVNVNPLYKAHELEHQLKDSGARAIVVVATSAAVLEQALPGTAVEHVIVTQIGDLLGSVRGALVNFVVRFVRRKLRPYRLPEAIAFTRAVNHETPFEPVSLTGADLACLQYTGGTTGVARGAMLSHGNLHANVRQVNTWFASLCRPGEEVVITALPLYHVYAMTCNCFAYTELGGLNVLITDPRDMDAFVRELRRWKFTAITGVNTLYQHLANHPGIGRVNFSHLRLVSAGGMAVMEATAKQWAKVTGTAIMEGYGLSETSPVISTNRPDLKAYNGTIGLPLPGTEVSLRDDDGREVAVGQPGELCAKGPQVMSGYWNDGVATGDVMTADGYLRTGDIAVMDERGYLRIVDRKKDMISVSGLKAYPNEVENVVSSHPAVLEAACIGVPDPETQEAIKVFVVLRPGMSVTADEIRSLCREHLAAFKVPRHVEFRDSLPKSNVGKILRRELRDDHAAAPRAASG